MTTAKKTYFDPDKSYIQQRRILSSLICVVFRLDYGKDKSLNVTSTDSKAFAGGKMV